MSILERESPSILPVDAPVVPVPQNRTIWGLDITDLHARFWAARGVQVVCQGEPSQIVRHAELYLLLDKRSLTIFRTTDLLHTLEWIQPRVLFVRLHDGRQRVYREIAVTDENDRFVKFNRVYDALADYRLGRIALTSDREIARLWQGAPDGLWAWRRLRKFIPREERTSISVEGSVYDKSDPREVGRFVHDLVGRWKAPNSMVSRCTNPEGDVWLDPTSNMDANAKFVGPVWVGAGRHVDGGTTVIGPAVLWDDPEHRPRTDAIQWQEIEALEPPPIPSVRSTGLVDRAFKRLFDLVFALVFIVVTLPLYPLIMLAIWIEDGRPFFFAHRRETTRGREFPCIKFRSMRRGAEQMKEGLAAQNQADGPQFFMEEDPRLTRVGRLLRKYYLDELPQFFNVLAGHMSVVGPRPSPRSENQYCPPWREARLSVRPGITGLWQVMRTRRVGADFQEWIRFDIEYVEKHSTWMDLTIVFKTISLMFRKMIK